jgi:hypothetical protein
VEGTRRKLIKGQLSEINERIELTEEKYIYSEINKELCNKLSAKYKAERLDVLQQLNT